MKPSVQLYQIAYSDATFAAIEPGYAVLDNRSNPRPDWYEYWAIRQHLMNTLLDESSFYGFFSPKFGSKTALSHSQVVEFMQTQAAGADVCLFSPQPDMAAFFLNVFEQGETFDTGFIDAFSAFLAAIGRPANLRAMVMDSRHIVFSNYFVARPAFWRTWLALTEKLFALCEAEEDSPLRQQLTASTSYPGAVQRKVFLMERVASYLLSTEPQWRSKAANPYTMAWSMTRMREFPVDAVISDALKVAMREQGFPEYLKAFSSVREKLSKRE